MAAKNEGNDMPMVVTKSVNLLRNLVLNTAVRTPINKPKSMAIEMDTAASNKVLGNASPKISDTLRLLWYDILKNGAFSTMAVEPMEAILA